MSDQSIGAYKALCREIEVKKSIKAVAQDESGGLDKWATSDDEVWQSTVYYMSRPRSSDPEPGPSLLTEQLEAENQMLAKEVLLLRDQATNAQEEVDRKDRETEQLRQEIQKLTSTGDYFQSCLQRISQKVENASNLLESLNCELRCDISVILS
ncbi:LOW QUALITY PROTEIN: uncharacterized protein PV07_12547 [Cladophialophora immunda]|uniref:Autophagy-related protein 16 domain-containing protein n=1 Tax=Cladophialophora immunda TaxID=569365 RepID=A0A0D2BUI8_9EURO|nr:LOW QUALITY PROTEIN: uncharacterized protein PV07_12547 [Cladophialophora immunda]KIW22055.1 LOW QUALITY PROTEIN: hypothetical protein PV07_12547 [Cladophialophora immunda]